MFKEIENWKFYSEKKLYIYNAVNILFSHFSIILKK